jgi:sugar phosphate isomerase/epimerase
MQIALAGGAGCPFETLEDLSRYLGAVADAGFPCVSLGLEQMGAAGEHPDVTEKVADLVRSAGLACPDVYAMLIGSDDAAARDAATKFAGIAEALGARHVLTLLRAPVSTESLDRLARCAEVVSRAGASLAIEFAPTRVLDSIPGALAAVEHIGPDRAGVLIDSWHFFRGPSTWEDLESIALDRIAYVQFADALDDESGDFMTETTQRRAWPGEGTLDLSRFATTLTARSWDGVVSAEVLSDAYRRLDVEDFTRRAFETTSRFWGPG